MGERRIIGIIAAAAALGASACKDDPTADPCTTLGPQGGIARSTDGRLSLSFRPNSLTETTEVCIELAGRPGPPAVYGEAYRVTPDIEVDVNISVTYREELPQDTSQTRVGVILREDFDAGQGRWLALPLTRLEPENDLVAGTDTRVSMFYGLLDDGGDGTVSSGTTTATTSGTTGTSDSNATTTPSTTGTPSTGDTGTTGDSSDETADPSVTDDETGDPTTGSTTGESDSDDTDNPSIDCENLPMGPFEATQIATLSTGGPEDLAMTGAGSFVLADGDTLVEMDGEGNTSTWASGLPFDEDILGIRFDSTYTLYAAMGLNSTELWAFTTEGGAAVFDTGLQLPNAIHIDSQDRIWVSDYFGDSISIIDTDAQTVTPVVQMQANAANGVFYDEQRGLLYWANYSSSQIYRAPVTGATVGAAIPTVDLTGFSDGMTMDECGNLYVVDQGGLAGNNPCRIDRIELDDEGAPVGDAVEIASAGELGNACANAQFGYGFGDDSDRSLFITGQQGNVYRMYVGLEGYPISLPE